MKKAAKQGAGNPEKKDQKAELETLIKAGQEAAINIPKLESYYESLH